MRVLLLARIGTSVAAARGRIRGAILAVLADVQLEGVGAPVAVDVIAADNGQGDATDGVSWTIPVLGVGRLRADVGRRRRAVGGRRGGSRRLGCRGRRARKDGGGRLGRTATLAGVVVPAIALGAFSKQTGRAAVLLNTTAPLAKVEALEGAGEASLSEARGDTGSAGSVGLQTVLLIAPVGQRRETPVTALILARGWSGDGGRAQRTGGRGAGPLGGCCAWGCRMGRGRWGGTCGTRGTR